jgi:hypothetical protein
MRELRPADIQHRVKGRLAFERRLLGLLRAVHRFGQHRATSAADQWWTATMIDGLTAMLESVRRVSL